MLHRMRTGVTIVHMVSLGVFWGCGPQPQSPQAAEVNPITAPPKGTEGAGTTTPAAATSTAPANFDDAVVLCQTMYKGPTHRVLLPTGQAFVATERDGSWQLGRGKVTGAGRQALLASVGALYGLPARMEVEGLVDGMSHQIDVAVPGGRHGVFNYGTESPAFQRVVAACEEAFDTIALEPGDESQARGLYLDVERWALGLPSGDHRRQLLSAWIAELKKNYPFPG